MTDRHRRTWSPAAAAMAAPVAVCVMLAGCGGPPAPAADMATPGAPASVDAGASTAPTPPAQSSRSEASTPSSARQARDACALVTEDDVTAALATDPGPGTPATSHGASQCQYGEFQSSFVLVNLTPSRGAAAYDHMRASPKLAEAGAVADVAGVGDRAFGVYRHGEASIWINQGDDLLLVMVAIQSAPSSPKGQALALAKVASSRL